MDGTTGAITLPSMPGNAKGVLGLDITLVTFIPQVINHDNGQKSIQCWKCISNLARQGLSLSTGKTTSSLVGAVSTGESDYLLESLGPPYSMCDVAPLED